MDLQNDKRLTMEDIKILSAPFGRETIRVKVQSFSKDRTKAMLICYLQHTDVYQRLEEVDPAWSCEPYLSGPLQGSDENLIFVQLSMTIKGATRVNAGQGYDYKEAYSDALKRTAMLFGVGRYLYDSEQVWIPYDESRDRYKQYTLEDYEAGLRKDQDRLPVQGEMLPQERSTFLSRVAEIIEEAKETKYVSPVHTLDSVTDHFFDVKGMQHSKIASLRTPEQLARAKAAYAKASLELSLFYKGNKTNE